MPPLYVMQRRSYRTSTGHLACRHACYTFFSRFLKASSSHLACMRPAILVCCYQDVVTPTLQGCAAAPERLAGITAKFPPGQLTAILGADGCGSGALLGAESLRAWKLTPSSHAKCGK